MDITTDLTAKDLTIIILAAGKGKRMNNPDLPKVMVKLDGEPLIGHVLRQALQLEPRQIIVVTGHCKEQVISYVSSEFGNSAEFVEQKEQLGTGHAALQTESVLKSYSGDALILSGDVPLLQASTMSDFVTRHRRYRPIVMASVLTMTIDNPAGYGRILRSPDGEFLRIVESKDAMPDESAVCEVNSGVYIVNAHLLFAALRKIDNNNAQKEFYLTDIIGILRNKKFICNAIPARDADELLGVNTPDDLACAERVYREKFAAK
ncbi:MAG: NTP transferase domain-containing protein [Bacteroidetes bacterium]|jgi:UDP-N-acetylglucosamine diphosphorylase/glucosamine-1-phosphate N-acetyltransferase|nr:NTP transferase domain-containing protein [Bacteroidota bacterium]